MLCFENNIIANLEAARVEATVAGQRTMQMNHFVSEIIQNDHLKVADAAAEPALEAGRLLRSKKDFLAEAVFHDIFILRLESGQN